MASKQTGRYCPMCEQNTMATWTTPNHLLHFLLSVFTCGFWVPVWILVAVGKLGGFRCSKCGSRV